MGQMTLKVLKVTAILDEAHSHDEVEYPNHHKEEKNHVNRNDNLRSASPYKVHCFARQTKHSCFASVLMVRLVQFKKSGKHRTH